MVTGVNRIKYGLFWLLGVPIPILIVAFLIFHLFWKLTSRAPFSSVERTLHEIDSDASGFGHRTSRRVDFRADTGCGMPEGCSGRRGGGAPCGAPRFVGAGAGCVIGRHEA